MGIITTQILGFGQSKPDPKTSADPKPVRGFDYAGQPMKEGTYYNGRPEHMAPEAETMQKLTPQESACLPERRQMARARAIAQHARERAHPSRTLEAREKTSVRMKAWWAKRRAAQGHETEKAGDNS